MDRYILSHLLGEFPHHFKGTILIITKARGVEYGGCHGFNHPFKSKKALPPFVENFRTENDLALTAAH
jgi:hypothetical protein